MSGPQVDPDAPVTRRELAALEAKLKRPPWPMDYLGDPMYLRLSALADELLAKRIAFTLRDLRQDQWVQESTNLVDSLRWTRLLRQFLMKRHVPIAQRHRGRHHFPYVPGARRIVEFSVPASGPPILYAAYADELHCAVMIAVGRERIAKARRPQAIRRLREELKATDPKECAQCQLQLKLAGEFVVSNSNSSAGSSVTPIQSKGAGTNGDVSKTEPVLLNLPRDVVVVSSSRETYSDDASLVPEPPTPLDGQPDATTPRSRLFSSSTATPGVGTTDNQQRHRE